jgi:hypothetical protein
MLLLFAWPSGALKRLPARWLLRGPVDAAAPWLACELGWFVAEYGRQPWTIYGVLPTHLSVSTLSVESLYGSLAGFVGFYTVLLVVEMYLMVKFARQGRAASAPAATPRRHLKERNVGLRHPQTYLVAAGRRAADRLRHHGRPRHGRRHAAALRRPNDTERRVVINTVGPHWDGNQVWFITGGGAMFAAWPLVYATAFSGFYWAMLAGAVGAVLPPGGLRLPQQDPQPAWRSTWDWGLFVGGAVPPLVFGIAFGNLLQGVPFHFDNYLVSTYTGSFWPAQPVRAADRRGEQRNDHPARRGVPVAPHRRAVQARAQNAALGAAVVMLGLRGRGLLAAQRRHPRLRDQLGHRPGRPARPAGQDGGAQRRCLVGQLRPLAGAVALPVLGIVGALGAALLTGPAPRAPALSPRPLWPSPA